MNKQAIRNAAKAVFNDSKIIERPACSDVSVTSDDNFAVDFVVCTRSALQASSIHIDFSLYFDEISSSDNGFSPFSVRSYSDKYGDAGCNLQVNAGQSFEQWSEQYHLAGAEDALEFSIDDLKVIFELTQFIESEIISPTYAQVIGQVKTA